MLYEVGNQPITDDNRLTAVANPVVVTGRCPQVPPEALKLLSAGLMNLNNNADSTPTPMPTTVVTTATLGNTLLVS